MLTTCYTLLITPSRVFYLALTTFIWGRYHYPIVKGNELYWFWGKLLLLHFIFSDIRLHLKIYKGLQLLQPVSIPNSCHCLFMNIKNARMKTCRMCAKYLEEILAAAVGFKIYQPSGCGDGTSDLFSKIPKVRVTSKSKLALRTVKPASVALFSVNFLTKCFTVLALDRQMNTGWYSVEKHVYPWLWF